MDPTKKHSKDITETKQEYHLNELSELMNAPVEKVRLWLQDEDVGPVSEDEPDVYGPDAAQLLRGRRQII